MIPQLIEKVRQHNLFITFADKNPQAFLAHVFIQDDTLQVGFYDADKQRMTTFVVDGNRTDRIDDQEVLLKDGNILPLELNKCVIIPAAAKKIFSDTAKKEFPKETQQKFFAILQQTPEGPIYNMTALTASFKTLNIKISAVDGAVKKFSCESLTSF
ncbi:MAG: hypothetical protein HY363_00800 [Candidatus Aenigmarchaeota archaeon]|nr:hypothetical protein [Candidatus Aenigmarchaeota archaeon]